ncbi:MAG: ABC transporter permease [Actinomycetota bacterium]|nr:ABC transporter permease [Actinomycetota bacterium]MDQ2958366.1 ABC transporter permease [Actinomycetota bacterium]
MISYFNQHHGEILGWLGWHARLSALPLLFGLIISLPLGWLARSYRWLYPPMVSLAGLLYTIPSLALFILLPGILKTKILDPNNVIVALTIYTVALLVRVVADGLAAVPDEVLQAATAMGYRRFGRLIRVELPIAVPVIGAGLRVAAVSNVSLVSVSALIGVPELGRLFTDGFQVSYQTPILLGILLSVVLALAFDTVIQLLTRLLTPWRRAVRPA